MYCRDQLSLHIISSYCTDCLLFQPESLDDDSNLFYLPSQTIVLGGSSCLPASHPSQVTIAAPPGNGVIDHSSALQDLGAPPSPIQESKQTISQLRLSRNSGDPPGRCVQQSQPDLTNSLLDLFHMMRIPLRYAVQRWRINSSLPFGDELEVQAQSFCLCIVLGDNHTKIKHVGS